ncbi:MAG: hydroxyisourate hydrolase [Candidatus Obscuribacterales bacterium]|nr:hydroxyisourate hydrolase [Candidatus Obscuribacterales bacterium]
MSGITTHVLDTSKGLPGRGVIVILEYLTEDGWKELGNSITNRDGRCTDLVPSGHVLESGIYRLYFDTQTYFGADGIKCFYPNVPVTFEVEDPDQHFHVPLLLSPFGYSTYRGS